MLELVGLVVIGFIGGVGVTRRVVGRRLRVEQEEHSWTRTKLEAVQVAADRTAGWLRQYQDYVRSMGRPGVS